MQNNKLLSVTDLSAYLYCPRKFFIEKVIGKRQPPNKAMVEGRIRHNVLENFSKKEKFIVESFHSDKSPEEIKNQFSKALSREMINQFLRDNNMIEKFSISPQELKKKINTAMQNDINLRIETIKNTMQKGFFGRDLWENLQPKYISEMPLQSEKIGLKGRADRVMISSGLIIPFELKTRETPKVWESDEIQVTSYAMLLEEKYSQPINIGILEAGNTKHEIPITPDNKQKVLALIDEVKQLVENKNPKFPSNFSKCQKCPWKKECEELD